MNALAVLAIGAMAQVFFSARVLVQWILSERAHKVLSSSLFWVLSLAGAYLLCIYGWLRHDFAIVMGQFVSYYVYLWNLKQKGVWGRLPLALRLVLLFTPPVVLLLVVNNASAFVHEFFFNADVPLWLLLFGVFASCCLRSVSFTNTSIPGAGKCRRCLRASGLSVLRAPSPSVFTVF